MSEARPRRPGERAFSLVLLGFSLFLLYKAYAIAGFSSVSSPGVLPMAAAAVMVATVAAVVFNDRRTTMPPGFLRLLLPHTLLATIGLLVALMLLLQPVGFVPAAGAFLFMCILVLQRGRPGRAALVSAISVAAIYVVFRLGFQVVLPEAEWL